MRCVYLEHSENNTELVCNAMCNGLHLVFGEADGLCMTALHADCPRYRYVKERESNFRSFQQKSASGISIWI
jgi:hypothetical protein